MWIIEFLKEAESLSNGNQILLFITGLILAVMVVGIICWVGSTLEMYIKLKYSKNSFKDPKRNTCFSLRSLTGDPIPLPDGNTKKKMKLLITFDAVDGPGHD